MEKSVADIQLMREHGIPKAAKVGLLLFALAWYLTEQTTEASFIVLGYFIFNWLLG
jgi:hypothetical protein